MRFVVNLGWTSFLSRIVWRYGYALLLVTIASTVSVAIENLTRLHIPVLFFLAVLLAGWYYGPGPGWIAALISVLVFAYFFASPIYSFRVDSQSQAFFVPFLVCIGMTLGICHARAYFRKESRKHRTD
jgi:two-component system sensor histidine kinase KdpD